MRTDNVINQYEQESYLKMLKQKKKKNQSEVKEVLLFTKSPPASNMQASVDARYKSQAAKT